MDDATLFMFPGSNACLSTQLLLDHAGVQFTPVQLKPGLHAIGIKARGFAKPTVPAMRISGERVQGSRTIASWVAAHHPDAQLLPLDEEQRGRVLAAEQQGERLQNAARRAVYVLGQDNPGAIRPLIDANFGRLPSPLRAGITRVMIVAASKGKGATRARLESDLVRIGTLLDEFDELVRDGLLGGDTPNVADFQIAPNLALLALAPSLGAALRSRDCWRIAERLLPTYPLDVDIEAPVEWVQHVTPSSAGK